jgi:hypothetical protein
MQLCLTKANGQIDNSQIVTKGKGDLKELANQIP